MKRKVLILVVMVIGLFSLSGCNNFHKPESIPETVDNEKISKAEIVLSSGELNSEDSVMGQMLVKYSDLVYKKSNGRIYIEIYASSQLGDERTQMQAVQMGALDIFRANTVFVGDFGADKLNLFALPYLFENRDHLWNVLDSEIGDELLRDLEENNIGMRALGYVEEGSRHFFTAKNSVTKTDDLMGQKLRVSETSILMDTVSALGASPTPISFGELFTSIQTGVVDGAEQPLSGYVSNSFDDVAPNLVLDGHTYSPGLIVISDKTWDKLSKEDQDLLSECAKELEVYNRGYAEKADEDILSDLKSKNINITYPENLSEWQEKVKPIYEKYGKEYLDLIEKIQMLAK